MSDRLTAISVDELLDLNSTLFLLILEYRRLVAHLQTISEAELELGDTV